MNSQDSKHGSFGAVPPRAQIHAHFPRFGIRLNTRPCHLPLRGDLSVLRDQAALQVPGGAGIPHKRIACLGTAGRSTRGCVAAHAGQGAQYAGDLRSDSRRHQLDPLHEMLGD